MKNANRFIDEDNFDEEINAKPRKKSKFEESIIDEDSFEDDGDLDWNDETYHERSSQSRMHSY
jgi:hypothetical protein